MKQNIFNNLEMKDEICNNLEINIYIYIYIYLYIYIYIFKI